MFCSPCTVFEKYRPSRLSSLLEGSKKHNSVVEKRDSLRTTFKRKITGKGRLTSKMKSKEKKNDKNNKTLKSKPKESKKPLSSKTSLTVNVHKKEKKMKRKKQLWLGIKKEPLQLNLLNIKKKSLSSKKIKTKKDVFTFNTCNKEKEECFTFRKKKYIKENPKINKTKENISKRVIANRRDIRLVQALNIKKKSLSSQKHNLI